MVRRRYRAFMLGMLVLGAIVAGGCEGLAFKDARSLLFPHLYKSEVWGFIAGLGTTFAAIPDLAAMLRRRSHAGMNPTMAAILAVFQVVWIYYGLLIGSRPVIAWNALAVVINSFSVGAFFYYARRERSRSRTTFRAANPERRIHSGG